MQTQGAPSPCGVVGERMQQRQEQRGCIATEERTVCFGHGARTVRGLAEPTPALPFLFVTTPKCSALLSFNTKSTFLCRIESQFFLQIHQNDRGGVKCSSPGQDREQVALTHSCLARTSRGHCTCLCSHPQCRHCRLPMFAVCRKEQAGASGNELLETLGEKRKQNSIFSS